MLLSTYLLALLSHYWMADHRKHYIFQYMACSGCCCSCRIDWSIIVFDKFIDSEVLFPNGWCLFLFFCFFFLSEIEIGFTVGCGCSFGHKTVQCHPKLQVQRTKQIHKSTMHRISGENQYYKRRWQDRRWCWRYIEKFYADESPWESVWRGREELGLTR